MEYIEIGKIISTHALKGELRVASDSDFIDERFKVGATVFIRINRQMIEYEITSVRFHQTDILITLNNLYDINLVTDLVGQTLYVPKDSLPELEEDEYYYPDLINLKVYSTAGEYIGTITEILEYPHGDILEIYNNDKKILIPFVKAFIKEVTPEKVIVEVIEGLL